MSEVVGIALATNRDGRLELFALAGERGGSPLAVWHRWQRRDGGWTGWHSLGHPGGGAAFYPAVARNKDGRLEVVVGGRDQAAWHRWQRREGGWSDWHSLERPAGVENAVTSTPVLAENHDGRLELFTLASDGAVWHRFQRREGGWSDWHSLERPENWRLMGHPAVARNKDGRLELFIKGYNDKTFQRAVWHRWQRPGIGWSDWSALEETGQFELGGLPAVAKNEDGRLELFAEAIGGPMWHRFQRREGGWSDWHSLGDPTTTGNGFFSMVVGAHADGRLVMFARDNFFGRVVWQREQAVAGGWSAWSAFELEGSTPPGVLEVPALALNAKGRLELWYSIQLSVDLYWLKQVSPNSSDWDGARVGLQPAPESTELEPPDYEFRPAGTPPA